MDFIYHSVRNRAKFFFTREANCEFGSRKNYRAVKFGEGFANRLFGKKAFLKSSVLGNEIS